MSPYHRPPSATKWPAFSELGLLEQPHTSAGRIPSQLGYRLYINELMRPKPLSEEEMRYIDGYLSEYADDPDLLLEKAAGDACRHDEIRCRIHDPHQPGRHH